MAYDEELAERVRATLDDVKGVAEIKMFGGLCFTVGGNMAVGVSHDDLLVRLSPDDGDAALAEPGVRLMEIGSRTSRGFLAWRPRRPGPTRSCAHGSIAEWRSRPRSRRRSRNPRSPRHRRVERTLRPADPEAYPWAPFPSTRSPSSPQRTRDGVRSIRLLGVRRHTVLAGCSSANVEGRRQRSLRCRKRRRRLRHRRTRAR